MSSPAPACPSSRLVDRHFAGRLRPGAERTLRAHLPGCEHCRARYERHLLLAEVDPRALGARERLGRGLGLVDRPAPAWGGARVWAPALAVAAAAVTLLVLPLHAGAPDGEAGFTARGGSGGTAHVPAPAVLQVFRVGPGGAAERASAPVHPGDELAFAYRNAEGWPYLMVFGVDGGGRIFWYHPAWTDAAHNPTSIPARAGEGPHELREAVRQPLQEGTLTLHALFSREPLSVREVEAQLARGGAAALAGPGRALHHVELGVSPGASRAVIPATRREEGR